MLDHYVDTSGNNGNSGGNTTPFKDIAFAESVAKPGDRVLVRSGQTHEITQDSEQVDLLTDDLEFTSTDPSDPAIIHYEDTYTPSNTNHGLIEISANDVYVHHLTFKARDFGSVSLQGLRAITSDDLNSTGLTYDNALIEACFFDNIFDGIHTNFVNTIRTRYCTFELHTTGFHQNAIIYGNDNCLAEYNTVTWNNTLPGRANDVGGIRMGVNSDKCVVRYNYIWGLEVDLHGSFSNGRSNGIMVEGTNAMIHNNTIFDMIIPDGGVSAGNDEAGGIIIGNAGTAKVFSNIVSSTSRPFTVLTGGVAQLESHNCFHLGSALFGHTAASTTIIRDPGFVASGSDNFALTPASVCRNKGLSFNNMGADLSRPLPTAGILIGV